MTNQNMILIKKIWEKNEKKVPNISSVVKKKDFNTKITEIKKNN